MAPYLSFIIPTLNEEDFLPDLLDDLQRQKDRRFEVIVVDGGSRDRTAKVVEKFGDQLSVRFVAAGKSNVSHQRNCGARLANGRYLVFLDADSRVDQAFVKKIIQVCEKTKFLIFIPSILPQQASYHDLLIFQVANFFIEASQIIGQPISSGGSMIFQKDYFQFLGGFDEQLFLAEDHEIVKRARQAGVSACILKNVQVKVSLRRFEKDGHFDVLKNYALAWFHYLASGRIYKKLFDYDMGGAPYKKHKS